MNTNTEAAPARRSLRSIVDELLEKIEAAEGEVTDEIDTLELTVEQKVEAYAAVVRQLAAENQAFEDLAILYRIKAKKRDEQCARLKQRLAEQLARIGLDYFKTKTATASFRTSESVEIADEAAFCERFRGTQWVRSKFVPDKVEIKESFTLGVNVEGACIVTRRTLQLR